MVRAYVGSFLSLAGLSCGLTWLYLGMRSVMEVGGACAEGGPYEIAQPCPEGVPLLMLGGIFGGLICLGLFLWFSSRLGGEYGSLSAYAWCALFLSLGWNFAEFGLDAPGEDDGLVWSWLFCAVLFFAMGGLPLVFGLAKPSTLKKLLWPADPDPLKGDARPVPIGAAVGESLTLGGKIKLPSRSRDSGATFRPGAPGYDGPAPAAAVSRRGKGGRDRPDEGEDVVDQLERLAALRDRGALDREEYERAKRAVLDG